MINITTNAKLRLLDNQKVLFKAEFTLDKSNGRNPYIDEPVLTLKGDDVMGNGATITDATSSSGSFDIGSDIINSLNITLNNFDERFSLYDFTGATMKVYLGIPLVDNVTDEDDTTQVEWVVKGYYAVDKPTSIGNTIPLTMLDNMSKFEVLFTDVQNVIYPITLDNLIKDICLHCGVTQGTSVPNPNWTITQAPEDKNLTCLDILGYIAQINGCYARADRNGELTFGWYDFSVMEEDEGDSYDGGTFLTTTTPYSDGDELEGGEFDGSSASYIDEEGVARVKYANPSEDYDGGTFGGGNYHNIKAFKNFSVATEDINISGIQFSMENTDESSSESEITYLYDKIGDVTQPVDSLGKNVSNVSDSYVINAKLMNASSYANMGATIYMNVESAPVELFTKHKYVLFSFDAKVSSCPHDEIVYRLLYEDSNGKSKWTPDATMSFTANTWQRVTIPLDFEQIISNTPNFAKMKYVVFCIRSDVGELPDGTTVNAKNLMVEVSDSTIASSYVGSCIYNGEYTYNDFVTVDPQRKIDASQYALEISNNKLMPLLGDLPACMSYVSNKIVGLNFRPFNITTLSSPIFEAGDIVKLIDNKGNDYTSVITSLSYPLNGYITLNCDAESVNEHNSISSNNLSTAIASVKNDTNVKLSNYDKAVRNLSSLSANALGFYESSEIDPLDGSKIEYMHDQPTLDTSLNAYKKSLSGFFIGHRSSVMNEWTWDLGVDMSGNAVFTTLSTKGINADWINAGSIYLSGLDDGVTFTGYNWAYLVDNLTFSNTFYVPCLHFYNEYSPVIDIHEMTSPITATFTIDGVTKETKTLSLGENQLESIVPAKSNDDALCRVVLSGAGTFSARAYHLAVDIRNSTYTGNIPQCDMYCYDFFGDYIKSSHIATTDYIKVGSSLSVGTTLNVASSITIGDFSNGYSIIIDPSKDYIFKYNKGTAIGYIKFTSM